MTKESQGGPAMFLDEALFLPAHVQKAAHQLVLDRLLGDFEDVRVRPLQIKKYGRFESKLTSKNQK